ncbi:biopolymer transporter ExbB [Roseicyclus persicicus]|uniref:Biopolymer transporter ExbB n=1 Tax=Roseicyclus persicicus TaxID=2650661 RepID=A0A7X6JWZ5_9RHOB|nr:biopolymer transporter ExbB [Roseibacterium persicicum]NKX44235.1 biopolymer transporter ExbB [Roseibacterium persicicum]
MASRPDTGAEARAPRITRPTQQIVLMLIICAAVAAGAVLIWPRVQPVFLSSPFLNGTIGVVFVVGVLACFFQVFQLFSSITWIEAIASGAPQDPGDGPPRLLAAMTGIARVRGSRMQVTGPAARSILDSVGARMEESRDITRYIGNLLIFLGLLGTFFGLATTVPAVVDTIRSLQPTEGEEGMAVFGRLMNGLEDQLGGMGTAFASSLLGLAGSLVVGLLELYAGHGQNRFYRELEEWLASITRVSFASGEGEGGGVDRTAIATVLDHMVDQMETLQSLFSRAETRRAETEARLVQLTAAVGALTDKLGPGPVEATERLAAAQERLSEVLEAGQSTGGIDEESRMRLRSIDVQLLKIYEDLGATRDAEIQLLRADITDLTQALRDLVAAARAPARQPRAAAPRPVTPPAPGGE